MAVTSSVSYTNTALYSSSLVAKKEDVSDMIHELAPWTTPILNVLPGGINGFTAINTTHSYQEQEWTPCRTTVATTATASKTTLTFSDPIFRATEQVRVGAEVITLGTTSDNLTFSACTRSAGAGAAATLTAGDLAVGANKMWLQGAAAGTAQAMIQPKQQSNYTTILQEDILVSGTATVLPRYGRGNMSEYDYQKEKMMIRCFKQLEERVLFGWSQAPSGGSTAGGMKGIYESVQGTNSAALGDANPTWANLESYIRAINAWDDGRSDLYFACSLYFAGVMDSWAQGHLTFPVAAGELPNPMLGANLRGLFIGGRRVIIIPYSYFDSQAFIFDPKYIRVGPLTGRAFHHVMYGADGDREKGAIVGEYTMECACPHAHYVLTGMKKS